MKAILLRRPGGPEALEIMPSYLCSLGTNSVLGNSTNWLFGVLLDDGPAQSMSSRSSDYFVVSTDYPHPDGAFPEAMKEFLALSVDDPARRKILWDNCARLYDILKPAAPLTRAAPASAAAQ
jgi:hypothetical protein